MLQHLLDQILLYYLSMVAHEKLKTKENFKLLALKGLKVVAVAYDRWSLARGSKYSDFTWQLLVIWKRGR